MSDRQSTPECIRIEFSNDGIIWPKKVKVRCRPYDSDGCWLAVTDILRVCLGKWEGSYEAFFNMFERRYIHQKMMPSWEDTSFKPEKELYAIEVTGWLEFFESDYPVASCGIDETIARLVLARMQEVYDAVREEDVSRVRCISATEHLERMWAKDRDDKAPTAGNGEEAKDEDEEEEDSSPTDEGNTAPVKTSTPKSKNGNLPLHYIIWEHNYEDENGMPIRETPVKEVCFLWPDMKTMLEAGGLDCSRVDGKYSREMVFAPYYDTYSASIQLQDYIPLHTLKQFVASYIHRENKTVAELKPYYAFRRRLLVWLSIIEFGNNYVPNLLSEVFYPNDPLSESISLSESVSLKNRSQVISSITRAMSADCIFLPPSPSAPEVDEDGNHIIPF